MSIVAERTGMHDSLSGATTNLLRMARSECRGALAFVALSLDDNLFATAAYPTVSDDDLFGEEEVDEVVHQAWADPEFGQARVFVRASRLRSRRLARPKRFVVAIVPLGDGPGGRPWGMLGVVDPESGGFEPPQLDLLDQIAQRLASHLRARQEIRETVAASTAASTTASNGPAASVAWSPDDAVPADAAAPTPAVPADDPSVDDPGHEDEPWWSVEPSRAPARPAEGAELAADRPEPAADRSEPAFASPPPPASGSAFSRPDPLSERRDPPAGRPAPPLWAGATPLGQLGQLGLRRPSGPGPSRAVLAGFVRDESGPDDNWVPVDQPEPVRPRSVAQPAQNEPAGPESADAQLAEAQLTERQVAGPQIGQAAPFQPDPGRSGPTGTERPGQPETARQVQPDLDIRFVAPPRAEPVQSAPTQYPPAQYPPAQVETTEPDLLPAFLSAGSTPGLVGLAAFVGRAGRMLGAGAVAGGGPLAIVVLEVVGSAPLDGPAVAAATAAIRRELRFDDPVAQLGPTVFVAAVPLVPGGSDGPAVEKRLAEAVRSASPSAESRRVRAAHVVAGPTERADADELLRSAMAMLREG